MRVRLIGSVLLWVGTCSSALGAPLNAGPEGGVVKQALAAHSYRRAISALNALIEQRLPQTDKGGPDPILDALYAEIASATGSPSSATPLLVRLSADTRVSNRPHYQFLLATAREAVGQFDEAERLYQQLSANGSVSSDDRLGATIGFARLRMMTHADEAIATLQAARPLAAQAWEVDLQLARAETLAGREDAAQAALARAWVEAPSAGAEQGAVARVASDLMIAAGRRGDRARVISLLSVDRLNRVNNTGEEILAADAPLCGSSGVKMDDSVAVEFMRQAPPGRPRFSLVWASRAGIGKVFLAAVAKRPALEISDGQATTVILRCRVAASSDYQVEANLDDQVLTWSTSHGAYPLLETGDADDASSMASMLAERERRYGQKSVMLLPVLIRILNTAASTDQNQDGRMLCAGVGAQHRLTNHLAPPPRAMMAEYGRRRKCCSAALCNQTSLRHSQPISPCGRAALSRFALSESIGTA